MCGVLLHVAVCAANTVNLFTECGSLPYGLGEDATVPLTPSHQEFVVAAPSTPLQAGIDISPIVNPSCRCLDNVYFNTDRLQQGQSAATTTTAAEIEIQFQVLQPSPLVWIDGVVITAPDGTRMWQVALDRQVIVGEWTTVRVAVGSARATNRWGATTSWSGAAPWNNVQVAVTRRTLFGTPSLPEVPVVRNIRLAASLQPGKALASYLAASPMTLHPQLGNDVMMSSSSHFTWKALNDYSQCIVAPSCVEVNMTEYFLNLTTATAGSDGSGSSDVLELDPTLFPPSNTEVRSAIAFWCARHFSPNTVSTVPAHAQERYGDGYSPARG